MLYLHCGWPRTGTTGFQAALLRKRERLAASGIFYPSDRWRDPSHDAHHGIVELLESETATEAAIAQFQGYLSSKADRSVLISTEALSNWFPEANRPSLLRLLRAAREVMPVTCLLTLRRADAYLVALHSHWFRVERSTQPAGDDVLSMAQWRAVSEFSRWLSGIAGISQLTDAVDGRFIYSRYDDSGSHYEELLDAVGAGDSTRAEIVEELRRGSRLNRRLSQKATIAFLHLDAISDRAGVEMAWRPLHRAWKAGKLAFADDAPCALVGSEVRRAVHDEALELSRQVGFEPYTTFFAKAEIEPCAPTALDPDILTDDDLEQLVPYGAESMSVR